MVEIDAAAQVSRKRAKTTLKLADVSMLSSSVSTEIMLAGWIRPLLQTGYIKTTIFPKQKT